MKIIFLQTAITAALISATITPSIAAPNIQQANTIAVSNNNPPHITNSSQKGTFITPLPQVQVQADSWILMDYNNGQILSQHNIHKLRKAASLTKVMSAYLIAQNLKDEVIKLDDIVPVSKKAWKTGGSKMFIQPQDKVTVKELIQGMIVDSGNDATVALAEFIAGSESGFVSMMNATANSLNMTNTTFSNADGLPGGEQNTTAYDMAILAKAFINDYPEIYKYYSQKEFTWSGITQQNRNKLLYIKTMNIDGMKTGYTPKAGYNLIASGKDRTNKSERLISVVMGAPSANERIKDSMQLMNFGFRFFEKYKIFNAGEVVSDIKIEGADTDKINLKVKNNVELLIPKGKKNVLTIDTKINKNLIIIPMEANIKLGKINIKYGKTTLYSADVYTATKVDEPGFFSNWF